MAKELDMLMPTKSLSRENQLQDRSTKYEMNSLAFPSRLRIKHTKPCQRPSFFFLLFVYLLDRSFILFLFDLDD